MDSDAVMEEKSPLGSLSGFTIISCHGVVLYMKEMELQNQNLPSLFVFFFNLPFRQTQLWRHFSASWHSFMMPWRVCSRGKSWSLWVRKAPQELSDCSSSPSEPSIGQKEVNKHFLRPSHRLIQGHL